MLKKLAALWVVVVTSSGISGCAISIGNQNVSGGIDASATFGNITVDNGEVAGNLQASNGNVEIGSAAKVQTVDVTNGNIEIDDASYAKSLETVNGNIQGGKKVVVTGNVTTVNGNIQFKQGAALGGNLETVNGDIIIAKNSTIAGDIIFSNSSGWSGLSSRTPKLELAEGVTVGGQIHLYRQVHVSLPDTVNSSQVIHHYKESE